MSRGRHSDEPRSLGAPSVPCCVPTPQGGFTLIETLVALLIFSFVLLGVASHLLTIIQSMAQARRMTDAVNVGQAALEALMNQPFGSVVTGANPSNPVTATGAAGGVYTVTWTVTAGSPATGLKDALVTTVWTDKDGTHSVRLRTVLSP
jgi:prepilin-type N-terminal cleavage/methylation domain-containing protein